MIAVTLEACFLTPPCQALVEAIIGTQSIKQWKAVLCRVSVSQVKNSSCHQYQCLSNSRTYIRTQSIGWTRACLLQNLLPLTVFTPSIRARKSILEASVVVVLLNRCIIVDCTLSYMFFHHHRLHPLAQMQHVGNRWLETTPSHPCIILILILISRAQCHLGTRRLQYCHQRNLESR